MNVLILNIVIYSYILMLVFLLSYGITYSILSLVRKSRQ